MDCPYCRNKMSKGFLYTAANTAPFWEPEGAKKEAFRFLSEKGKLPFTDTLGKHKTESYYCGQCRKLIIDADLHL